MSCWLGEHDLNYVSIGIEIVNPGHEWGYREFPEPQMRAVEALCRDIVARRRIPPYRIVGHSDIAPDRKSDPGELFDWQRLARAGIGLWPPSSPDVARRRGRGVGVIHRTAALADLARIGYCVSRGTEQIALAAFQRRFRPERWDGLLDARDQPAAARRAARGRGGAGRRSNTAAQPVQLSREEGGRPGRRLVWRRATSWPA